MNMKRIAIGFALALVSTLAQAGIDGATKTCTPGTWTTSIDNARKVGKANKRFIAIAWGKSEGCGFCNAAANNVFNKAAFKNWSKENGIPILWADDLDGGSCSEWIWNKYYGGGAVTFAQFLVIDPNDGDELLLKALFQGSTVQYGTKSKTSASTTGCPNAWLLSPFNPSQTIGMIDWVISRLNNTVGDAVTVTPDALSATALTVNRLWNTYGTRSLSCENLWTSSTTEPKIKLMTHAEDQYDWFKFAASKEGAYQVKLQDYVDSHNEGQLYVYADAAAAKSVTAFTNAADKAMASCPMADIDANGGWKFVVPAAGTYYLLFARPDSEKCKQQSTKGVEYDGYVEKTLTYNFTLQETEGVDSGDYWFGGQLSSGREGTTNELIVTRSETESAGSVNVRVCDKDEMTDIPLAKPEDYASAVKGSPDVGDYYLIDANGNVLSETRANTYACSFAAGESTSKIRLVFNRGKSGVQRRDRAFGLRLAVEAAEAEAHYHEAFVTIEDVDKPVDEYEGALNATETPQRPANDFSLIGQTVSHTYFFTNVAHTAGSVYGFFVQAAGANDFADGRLKVEVIRTSTGERLVPVASNLYDAATSTIAAGDSSAYVTYIYGTDSTNGFSPDGVATDVVVRVSRAAAAAGEFPDVRYWLQWQRFDRPVVSFARSGVSFTTEERPVSVVAPVAIDTLAGIRAFHAPFALDVAWKTAAPESGSAATVGVDYEAVADGLETFAADAGTLAVNLKEQATLSYPTRAFTFRLRDDPNMIYVVDDKASAYTVTLKKDNVEASGAGMIGISGTEWRTTGEEIRNLNYTNVEDWITVTGVQNGQAYRLKALDVFVRPEGEETNVTVAVYANGAASAYAYRLSDLIMTEDAQAPILMFSDLSDGTVRLKVSREKNEQDRVEYRLAMREENDAGLDEADPSDDTRDGATAHQIAADGVEANFTRLLNGLSGFAVDDQNDWFRFTGIAAGETYCFTAKDISTNAAVRAEFYRGNGATAFAALTLAELAAGYRYDAPTSDDVFVRICREPAEKYALVKYTLAVARYIWPVVGFTTDSVTVTNTLTDGTVSLDVYRHFNTNRAVHVDLSADCTAAGSWGDAYYLAGVLPAELAFLPCEAVTNTVKLGFRKVDGAWVGDWTFDVALNIDATWCRAGSITNVRVKVVDQAMPEKDPTDGPDGDDFREGAAELDLSGGLVLVTNHLNGIDVVHEGVLSTDTNDWFRLTGLEAGFTYRISIPAFVVNNVEGIGFSVTVESEKFTKTVPGSSLVDGKYLDIPSPTGEDIYIRIARTTCAFEAPVSVAYMFGVVRVDTPAPAVVRFWTTAQTVSGAAAAVYVDVECATADGKELSEAAVVSVWPQEDVGAVAPAQAGVGFDAEPIELTWAAGSTGGVQRIAVPIGGSSGVWKGDETFLLVLSNETDNVEIAESEDGGRQRVTVTDIATPVYGTVGITQAGADEASLAPVTAKSVLTAREGDTVVVRVTRVGGQSGWVDGVWTWKDGSKTVGKAVQQQLFAGVTVQEATATNVILTVPTTSGYQAKRTLTLNFAIDTAKAKTVTVTKGTPTALKFSVGDKDYADVLSAYSANDPAKVGFKASGAAWFLDTAGGVRAAVSANATQTMSASVTGPGTLTFDATVAGGCKLAVKVNGKELKTLTASSLNESVRIEANGAATVSFLCVSPKTLADDSACAVSNVRFARDDAANRYGTFSGKALVNDRPGQATLTVSSAGKISGKMICSDRTWTFSATGGWTDDTFTATLKSGSAKLENVTFRLDLASGEVSADGDGVAALFARNVWSDKPLSDAAAEAYANCVGYFTATLKAETGADGAPLYGSGYCGLTVSKSGVVKAAGRLADGQTLSASGTLAPADELATTFLFAKPSAYKGGWYFVSPEFESRDFGVGGAKVVVTKAASDEVLKDAVSWTSFAPWTAFAHNPGLVGGWYDKTENLYDHYAQGLKVADVDAVSAQAIAGQTIAAKAWAADEEHPVTLAFNASGSRLTATCGGSDRFFTVSLTRATGLFSGSFRATYDYTYGGRDRTTTKSFAYQGMLIPYAPEGETAAGRGYFLMPEKNAAGKTVNKSYEIEISEDD